MAYVNQRTGETILEVHGITKSYQENGLSTQVLRGVTFVVKAGEKVAIVGSSGSGKSTLLHLLGGLDKPDGGRVIVCGQEIYRLSEKTRGVFRNRNLGFIYQLHHLLPEFTALENVAMPLLIRGYSTTQAEQCARMMLERVGLLDRMAHKPGELSGGERQRVAVARAAITEPRLILADEPTGNLDRENAQKVFQLMLRLNTELETALVVVTHDSQWEACMDQVLRIVDGRLEDQAIPA